MASSITELIKEKLDIVDFLRGYLDLRPAGKNWKALCPFHKEKTPSFMVSPERQSWHCFGCFPKGSLVKTPTGFHAIDSLKIGDTVVSGKGREKKIIFTLRHMYDGDLVRITVRKLGGEVALTGDHRVFVIKGASYTGQYKNFSRRFRKYTGLPQKQYLRKVNKYFPIVQVFARDLSVGDRLLYPINREVHDVQSLHLGDYLTRKFRLGPVPPALPPEIPVDDKLLKLLGYWIAEGSNHRAYVRFSLGGHELVFAEEIRSLIRDIFGLESSIHIRRGRKSGIEVTCCHAGLADIFANLCGKGADQKHIPFALRALPPEKQAIILDAIWKGDGTLSKKYQFNNPVFSITTISPVLSEQLVDILLRKGIFPSLTVETPKTDKNNVHHRESYTVSWGADQNSKYQLIYKDEGGTEFWVLPISSLKTEKFRGEVYNLTIEEDHSYVARNFAVSNCGLGGDIFTFLMRYENLEFGEALRVLAEKAGVELRRLDPAEYKFTGLLYELNAAAAKFFRKSLESAPAVKEYLALRGLKPETIEEFEIGWAPNEPEALSMHFLNSGYSPDDILRAGLAIKAESGLMLDRFRGRIMFPIHNNFGRVVGFTGRLLPQYDRGEVGKYINSPETPIFSKARLLYGFWKSKNFIREAKSVFLVEGQMDFLASWQAGIKNVVASSGTALTEDHLRTLRRLTEEIVLSFDNDEAGSAAAERVIDLAEANDFSVKVALFKDFKDPAEAALAGAENLKLAVEKAVPAPRFYFEKYLPAAGGLRYDRRGDLRNLRIVLAKIANIASPVEKSFWFKELSKTSGVKEAVLLEEADRIKTAGAYETKKSEAGENELKPKKYSRRELLSERLLRAAVARNDYSFLGDSEEYLTPLHKNVLAVLKSGMRKSDDPAVDELLNFVVLGSEDAGDAEIQELKIGLAKEYFREKRKLLSEAIKKAELEGDEDGIRSALEELSRLPSGTFES